MPQLAFRDRTSGAIVNSGFMASRPLAFRLLTDDSPDFRVATVENEMMTWTWSEQMINDTMADIEPLLRDPNLELIPV